MGLLTWDCCLGSFDVSPGGGSEWETVDWGSFKAFAIVSLKTGTRDGCNFPLRDFWWILSGARPTPHAETFRGGRGSRQFDTPIDSIANDINGVYIIYVIGRCNDNSGLHWFCQRDNLRHRETGASNRVTP